MLSQPTIEVGKETLLSTQRLILTLFIVALAFASCQPDSFDDTTASPPTSTPAPASPSPEEVNLERSLANVEELDLLILESFPVQVHAVISGILPDGCTTLDEISASRDGNRFSILLVTAHDASAPCTEAEVPFEETVVLDVLDLAAGTYQVDANGVTDSFELQIDNQPVGLEVPGADPCPRGPEGTITLHNPSDGYCLHLPEDFSSRELSPGVTGIYGPLLDENIEPVQVSLTIHVEQADMDSSLEALVDEIIDSVPASFPITPTRSSIILDGEAAELVKGLPGRATNNQVFALHDGKLYVLVFSPVDPGFPQAAPDMERLWEIAMPSLAYLD